MHLHKIILLTIATLTPGCNSLSGGACGDSSTKDADIEITEQVIQNAMEREMLSGRGEVTCELACQYAYQETDYSSYVESVDNCSFNLDPTPGAASEDVVGSVQCVVTTSVICEGRRPLGHVEARTNVWDSGAYFARCAHLEAASVVAFKQLATRLHRWGAPQALVHRCWEAAEDEVDHAQRIGALARSLGATVPEVEVTTCAPTILEVALDNAVEGCVLETWAALRAHWVAQHGKTAEIREIYAKIAEDETRHAQLAWDLHEWFLEQLAPLQRARVDTARRRALDNLPQLAHTQSQRVPAVLGLPASYAQIELAARFVHGLHAAA